MNRSVGQAPGFLLLSAKAAGVEFTNRLARARMVNANLLNGAGVAAGDVDGDGLCDLYLCSLDGDNGLFKNLGDWKFRNITAVAGVGAQGMSSTGAAFGDLDGDGDLDIYVANYGETSVLRSGGSKGPARLGSGSSGRYSRNSDTQILGATGRIRSVEVTWPSGIKSVEPVTNPAQLLELGL